MIEESGSFRDPAGAIFYIHDRIFRKINKVGIDRVNFLEKNIASCLACTMYLFLVFDCSVVTSIWK